MEYEDKYFVGTDLKFAITINCEGFDMDSDEYELQLRCSNKKVTLQKSDIVLGDQGEHYLLVDTTQFPSGTLRLIVTAKVPDDDFDNGIRREVGRIDLCYISYA